VAVIVALPGVWPVVYVTDVTPFASVVVDAALRLPPPEVIAQVTVTLADGLPY
jgi:hypothetical protein